MVLEAKTEALNEFGGCHGGGLSVGFKEVLKDCQAGKGVKALPRPLSC